MQNENPEDAIKLVSADACGHQSELYSTWSDEDSSACVRENPSGDRPYPGSGITRADSVCNDEPLLSIRSAASTSDCGSDSDVTETGCDRECGTDIADVDDCVPRESGYDWEDAINGGAADAGFGSG